MKKVYIILDIDLFRDIAEGIAKRLDYFSIPYEIRICSALYTPERVIKIASEAIDNGFGALIVCSATDVLPGLLAANTILPIIRVPLSNEFVGYINSNLNVPFVDRDTPILTVSSHSGAENAAFLVAQIFAVSDSDLGNKLVNFKRQLSDEICIKDEEMLQKYTKK